MIPEHFRVASMSLAVDRECFDRGRRRSGKVGPKMKKRKLGRALESVREDFRVGKHTGLSVLRVRFSPRSFSSPCHPPSWRRPPRLIARIPSSCERFSSGGHVHARTCAICLRAQCPLISARYTLAGDSLQRSVGWLYVTPKIGGIAIASKLARRPSRHQRASTRILLTYL